MRPKRHAAQTFQQIVLAKGFTSVTEFAEKAGLARGTVSAVHRGQIPTPRVRNAMTKTLGITDAELEAAIDASRRYLAVAS